MCFIKKGLLLELVEARGYSLNSFSKEINCDIKTLQKFNNGQKIRKKNAVKIFTSLKHLPLIQGDVTNQFEELEK